MKKKGILIYSILISMVFSFAIIYFVLALTIEYKTGNYRTERLFYTLCEDIENSADGFPAMDTIEKEGNFAAITIFKNRRCIFSYPSENAQNIESTKFIKVNKKTIQNGNSTLELTAAMYTLRPLKIFQYGKFSFIVISIATLFTIGLIIYNSIKDDNEVEETDNDNPQEESSSDSHTETTSNEVEIERENANNDKENDDEDEKEDGDNNQGNAENSSEDIKTSDELKETEENNIINDEQNECNEAEQEQIAHSNSSTEYKNDEQNTDLNENTITEADSAGQDKQEIIENSSIQNDTTTIEEDSTSNQNETNTTDTVIDSSEASTNEAQKIFSVSTGFCLQDQLQTRLDAELVRCGASELDLSLFIVKITNSEISEEIAKKIGDCILGKIQFRDCIFEHGKNSFAIIIPEIEIEQAEDFAEELYNDIAKIIDNTDAECFIGISSKTMRVISPNILITEAEEALEHATKDGKSKIIGFHVDIEKYRQFIKDKTK
ncbi:MAG: hypothetical protein HDR51_08670 [Treponema sp.]|nr:hypothetical protein [Treponema sp.]